MAGPGGGKTGDFALRQRQFATAETGALAGGVDIRDAGLLPAVNLYRLLRRAQPNSSAVSILGISP